MVQVKKVNVTIQHYTNFDTIETYARFKSDLRKKGLPIDDFDLLIGPAAEALNMILVTDNVKHIERLNIQIENWVKR